MKKIGFIDYYLDEWHANKYPDWIREATNGSMEVAYAYAIQDAEQGISNKEWCERNGVTWIDTIEALVALSDYVIVLSPDHPQYHEMLAQIPLSSGKPTYIDKTFTPDHATALRLFEIASEHKTPIYSSSALRFAREYAEVNRTDIKAIASWGPGSFEHYSIHQIEPIVSLMGPAAKRVMYIGTAETPALLIDYGDGRQATIHQLGDGCPFTMAVSHGAGECHILKPESDFFQLFIAHLVKFFETGRTTVPSTETIAIMAIIESGRIAAGTPYQWVELPHL